MPLPGFPTFELTWRDPAYYAAIAPQSTGALQCAVAIIAIVDGFIALGWTCRGSSDAVTSNLSGTNLWTSTGAIVNNSSSGNRSWIVLRNADGCELCLHFNGTTLGVLTGTMSVAAGFTGGSLTAAPTATDQETVISTSASWGFGVNAAAAGQPFRLIITQTVDHRNTYAFIMYRQLTLSMWLIGRATQARTNWSPLPLFAYIDGSASLSTSPIATYTRLSQTSRIVGHVAAGTLSMRTTLRASLALMSVGRDRLVTGSERVPVYSMGLACLSGAGRIGVHGRIPDIWRIPGVVPSGTIVRNPTAPEGPTLIALGSLLVVYGSNQAGHVI